LTTTKGAIVAPMADWDRWFSLPPGAARLSVERWAGILSTLLLIGFAAMLWRARRRAAGYLVAAAGTAIAVAVAVQVAGAMAAGIAVFPSSVDFGSQIVSTTTPSRIVSITNVGADALNVTNISVSGDFAQVNTCGASLAAGATCSITVTFTPTVAGSRTGTLGLVDSAPGSPHNVALSGTGVAAPTAGSSTPAGSYIVTITGTAGSLTHTTAPSLTVQ
jgi:hypothetical protein